MGFPQFILASASPARRRLLQSVGIEPIVRPSDFDESQIQIADPEELVQTLALRKAETVAVQLEPSAAPLLVMGCDSVLAIHGEIHGKPASPQEAIARWQQMRGQVGELYTGHVLIELQKAEQDTETRGAGPGRENRENRETVGAEVAGGTGKVLNLQSSALSQTSNFKLQTSLSPTTRYLVRCQMTQVHFAQVSDRQIAAYVATGEPLNCAGCFALEGKGGAFVEKLHGCHSNVIGLSLPLLRQMLAELGYDIADFW
jgi:septum formation protein